MTVSSTNLFIFFLGLLWREVLLASPGAKVRFPQHGEKDFSPRAGFSPRQHNGLHFRSISGRTRFFSSGVLRRRDRPLDDGAFRPRAAVGSGRWAHAQEILPGFGECPALRRDGGLAARAGLQSGQESTNEIFIPENVFGDCRRGGGGGSVQKRGLFRGGSSPKRRWR